MPRKKAHKATILSVTIKCTSSEKTAEVPFDKLYWHGWASPCELCGEHGGIQVEFTCPICDQRHEITLSEW